MLNLPIIYFYFVIIVINIVIFIVIAIVLSLIFEFSCLILIRYLRIVLLVTRTIIHLIIYFDSFFILLLRLLS